MKILNKLRTPKLVWAIFEIVKQQKTQPGEIPTSPQVARHFTLFDFYQHVVFFYVIPWLDVDCLHGTVLAGAEFILHLHCL